jgi:hypothetical protein
MAVVEERRWRPRGPMGMWRRIWTRAIGGSACLSRGNWELWIGAYCGRLCSFVLFVFFCPVFLSGSRRWVAVGAVGDGETGSIGPAMGDLNRLGVLSRIGRPQPS